MRLEELILAGFGGQGLLSAGGVLAHAAMTEGREVAWIPSYGPEMRGGTANCTVIVSDELIGSPNTARPSGAIVMNLPSFEKFEATVKPGGVLVVNSSLVEPLCSRTDIRVLYVPVTQIAKDLGHVLVAANVALGALNEALALVSLDSLADALAWSLPAHRHNLLPLNVKALEAGAEAAKQQLLIAR